jgi:hypothetical protein
MLSIDTATGWTRGLRDSANSRVAGGVRVLVRRRQRQPASTSMRSPARLAERERALTKAVRDVHIGSGP